MAPGTLVEPQDIPLVIIAGVGMAVAAASWWKGFRARGRLIWAVTLALVTVPWFDLHAHTHWYKVGWIPFVTPPVKISDIVANVLLYTPLGFLASSAGGSIRRVYWRTAAEAGLLSFVLELTQLYSHSRFPSFTDVVCNVCGALMGVWLAGVLRTRLRAWPGAD